MRKFIITVLIALLSYPALAQDWTPTGFTFNKEYSRAAAYSWVDSVWLYEGGAQSGWIFSYNVELFINPKSQRSYLGAIMRYADSDKGDAFFYVFKESVGGFFAFTEGDDEIQECLVEIFRNEHEEWRHVAPGALKFVDDKVQVRFGEYRLDYTQ